MTRFPVERPIDPLLSMTIEDVCRMPVDYHSFRTVSARELISRSGYRDRWNSITVEMLADTLGRHPDWVDAWIKWSEDKRVSSGWYIARREDAFDVGHYPTGTPVRYTDPIEACATFVSHEVWSIADVEAISE